MANKSKSHGEASSYLYRWTRTGVLQYEWSPFESFEKLVLHPGLRQKLLEKISLFNHGAQAFHDLFLPWRYGIFFYGPSGSGKSAASRAIARTLGWSLLTIPAHEILDAHVLEHALADAVSRTQTVVVLEDVDLMVRTMEPEVFFNLIDHAMQRAEGIFWIANSRHAENAPKTQLLRPGRFDEAIRLEIPHLELRKQLFAQLLPETNEGDWVGEFSEQSDGLTYAHFEEIRQTIARMRLEKKELSEVFSLVKTYIEDQMIAGDRWGGISDATERLQERVDQVDARVLAAALDMTDVLRTLMEKTIADAAEKAAEAKKENGDLT